MHTVGVDGAKSGWIAVWHEAPGKFGYAVYATPTELVSAHASAKVIAVDIPIGLSDAGPRAPDTEARRFVGGWRASSIFSAPVRGVLDATSQPEASERHRAIDGRGIGAQSFAILPKIRAWDTLLQEDHALRERIREIHPEVSFAALNLGTGLKAPKKTAEGEAIRSILLGTVYGPESVKELLAKVPRRVAARDDVLDALVALWSADRILEGAAASLPGPPAIDGTGLRTAIWY